MIEGWEALPGSEGSASCGAAEKESLERESEKGNEG